jgi:hypothetical protein
MKHMNGIGKLLGTPHAPSLASSFFVTCQIHMHMPNQNACNN